MTSAYFEQKSAKSGQNQGNSLGKRVKPCNFAKSYPILMIYPSNES